MLSLKLIGDTHPQGKIEAGHLHADQLDAYVTGVCQALTPILPRRP